MTSPLTTLVIDKDYGLVILASSAIALEYFLTPAIFVAPVRRRVFKKEFLEQNFGEVHKLEVGNTLPKGGYPDHGNGRYSLALSYKDWYDLNNAYRVHLNFGEQIGIIIPFTLLGGLAYPRVAAGLGLFYFISRLIYGVGYVRKPHDRNVGSIGNTIATIGLGVLSVIAGYSIFKKKFL